MCLWLELPKPFSDASSRLFVIRLGCAVACFLAPAELTLGEDQGVFGERLIKFLSAAEPTSACR